MEDRARARRGGGGVLQCFETWYSYVDDPDVWHEALLTWPSLGVDRAASR